MPPSPTMRLSPGRQLRGDNHRRRHSLEGGILPREEEDDLALFNDMQTRERDNFLLQSNEEFEDIFSTTLRHFSDYKLGISIPSQGQSSDLLNVDGEKNDYDWLLSPPDTPLFPSLDDETPPITLAQRGRPRSQPITISRSLTMEKSHRSSRGSASPNRLSPSPRSGNNNFQTRGRPSSSSHSSPTPSLHHTTSSRRPSPPPSKPLTPAPRSSTPTPRRMSTGSSGTVSTSGRRGTSPVKTSRGNSASPKIRAWQMNIPGFSLDAPPNLCTSLADRPTSYVRGSSPASRNGKDSLSRSGRQSMSPTASRSVGSSHSHDRERLSYNSKGSVASSGDDDVNSLQSIPMSSSDHAASRRVGQFQSNRGPTFSRKTTRSMLSSSAPKRSFDTALRQMDNRKGPQNMFRPLLSSVPSSSFYAGKAGSVQRPMVSRNSSVTTSSNASSDLGTSGPHDTEESDRNQYDMANECVEAPYPDVEDDVFAFEKADTVNEDISHDSHGGSCNVQRDRSSGGAGVDSQLSDTENFDNSSNATIAITTRSECVDVKGNFPEVDNVEDMVLCSRCGCRYCPIELIEGDLKICPDCRRSFEPLTSTSPVLTVVVPTNSPSLSANVPDEHMPFDAIDPLIALPESSEGADMAGAMASQGQDDVQEDQTSYLGKNLNLLPENSLAQTLEEEDIQSTVNKQLIDQPTLSYNPSDGDAGAQQSQHSSQYQNSKLDVSDGTGISVVLKRSSSSRGPVVQSRTFSATSIPYNDPSYVRDGATSMRSSLGQGSSSTSSSLDFGSVRQMETRMQRQLSGRKSDLETYRHDINTKHQRAGSSFSGTSGHAVQGLGLAMSTSEETMEVAVNVDNEALGVTNVATPEMLLVSENVGVDDAYTGIQCDNHHEPVVASASELSTQTLSVHLGGGLVAPFLNIEDSSSYSEAVQNDQRIISDQEPSVLIKKPSDVEEDILLNSVVDRVDVADVPIPSSLDKISEIDIENSCLGSPGSQSDVVSTNSKSTLDEFVEHSVVITCDNDMAASVAGADTLDNTHGILEESTVTVESHAGTKARSLTLEEATDTILFCSSIIHNVAYKAATIALEKENSVPLELEGSRPMVTILGNSNSDVKGPHRRTAGRRASKSQKLRQTPAKADTKPSPGDPDGDENVNVSTNRIVGVPNKGDSMKPPKLESKCNCTIM